MPWDLFRSEFFYPTCKDIFYINSFCIELTCKSASIFRVEFRDKCKATAKYLSSIGEEKSMKKLEKEEKTAVKIISASNCVSEIGHAAATYDLQVCETIDLQHCAARGQSESNNYFRKDI